MRPIKTVFRAAILLIFAALFCLGTSYTQSAPGASSYGPYNGVFRPDGNSLRKSVEPTDTILQATSPWSLYCWFQSQESDPGPFLLAGVGNPLEEYSRYLGIRNGKLIFWMGDDKSLAANAVMPAAEWHFVAATFDGAGVHLYSEGQEVSSGKLALGRVGPSIQMAPEGLGWKGAKHFGGKIAALTLLRMALNGAEIRQLYAQAPNPSLIEFEEGSRPWPIQTRLPGTGKAISDNFYWLGGGGSSYRGLNKLPPASLAASATATRDGDEIKIQVQLENRGTSAALANKLTLETASDGARILPVYLSDNYVSLLPGETRAIEIEYPAIAAPGPARLEIRGWNLSTIAIPISNR